MGGYIGARAGTISATVANVQDVTATDTTPEVTIKNTTETDADGGRSGKITFKGEQSGGEESTLAQIVASHDTAVDDEKGDLIFKTNDGSDGASPTERLKIDSSGVVNVGTASGTQPSYFNSFLNVQNNAATSDHASITITSGTGGYAGLHFGDSANGRIGQVAYNNTDDVLLFTANNSERLRIQSGGGISFNGDTAADNALDDYEEGTFNFEMVGYHGSPTTKLTIPAHYTKIGNTVHFWAHSTSMNTTGYSGNMWFTGLPFSAPSPYSIGNISLDHIGTYSGYGPHTVISGTVVYAELHQSNASSWSPVMHNVHTSAGAVYLSGHYKV